MILIVKLQCYTNKLHLIIYLRYLAIIQVSSIFTVRMMPGEISYKKFHNHLDYHQRLEIISMVKHDEQKQLQKLFQIELSVPIENLQTIKNLQCSKAQRELYQSCLIYQSMYTYHTGHFMFFQVSVDPMMRACLLIRTDRSTYHILCDF